MRQVVREPDIEIEGVAGKALVEFGSHSDHAQAIGIDPAESAPALIATQCLLCGLVSQSIEKRGAETSMSIEVSYRRAVPG